MINKRPAERDEGHLLPTTLIGDGHYRATTAKCQSALEFDVFDVLSTTPVIATLIN